MLESCTAQNGSTVIRQQGRLLASLVDPQAEARDWIDRQTALLKDVRTIFVLGLGCGYHVNELAARFSAGVVVLEFYSEICTMTQSIHSFDAARVKIECLQNSRQLRQNEVVRRAIAQSFLIVRHGPSMLAQPQFYSECQKQLLGRDWGSLSWQWQLRGLPSLDPQIQIGNDQALTIHDLEQTELVQDSEERERMLIKALRELVK